MVIFTGMSAASRPSSTTRHKQQILTLEDSSSSGYIRGTELYNRLVLSGIKIRGFSFSNAKRIDGASPAAEIFSGKTNDVVLVSTAGNNRLSTKLL